MLTSVLPLSFERQNNELQRTSDGNAAGSPLNPVFCGQ
jgi:hypothetical protein